MVNIATSRHIYIFTFAICSFLTGGTLTTALLNKPHLQQNITLLLLTNKAAGEDNKAESAVTSLRKETKRRGLYLVRCPIGQSALLAPAVSSCTKSLFFSVTTIIFSTPALSQLFFFPPRPWHNYSLSSNPFQGGSLPFSKFEFLVMWLFRYLTFMLWTLS